MVEVFISYSHKDDDLRQELDIHLANLKRQGKITAWHDRAIEAGEEWEEQIKGHLESARIILLLISPHFMASRYCYNIEMQRAIERHQAGAARVIPIILKPTDWEGTPFSKLQVLPKDAKPITKWEDRDDAFLNVVQGIRQAVESPKKVNGLLFDTTQIVDQVLNPTNLPRSDIGQDCKHDVIMNPYQETCKKAFEASQILSTIRIEEQGDSSDLFIILIRTNRPKDVKEWLNSSEAKKLRTQGRPETAVSIIEIYDTFGEEDLLLKVRARNPSDEQPVRDAIVTPLKERYHKNFSSLSYKLLNVRFEYSLPSRSTQLKAGKVRQNKAIKVFVYFTDVHDEKRDIVVKCCKKVVNNNSSLTNSSGSIIGVLNGLFVSENQILAEYIFPCGGYYDATDVILDIEDELLLNIKKTTLFAMSFEQGDEPDN